VACLQLLCDEVVQVLKEEVCKPLAGEVADRKAVAAVYDGIDEPERVRIFELAPELGFQDRALDGRIKLPHIHFEAILCSFPVCIHPLADCVLAVAGPSAGHASATVSVHAAHKDRLELEHERPVNDLVRKVLGLANFAGLTTRAIQDGFTYVRGWFESLFYE